MNCNHCRYELSQCLDGRLPSGRRAQVMQHAERCGECGRFWSELQAAQQLALDLPRERVGERFREQLWERIRAGEGTPEAVFHEPVPFATKLRYSLTGAAAAAAVLLGVLSLRPMIGSPSPRSGSPESGSSELVADSAAPSPLRPRVRDGGSNPPRASSEVALANDDLFRLDHAPLFASTQRLTTDVVALEAARQLEQRYATVHHALGRMQDRSIDVDIAVGQVLENADEFHTFGELLLEMNDRRRLVFVEPEVGADLRVAVGLLGQTKLLRRDQASVTSMVGKALQSQRLGNISGMISLVPMDPREEREVLVRMNVQRPEVFPKLFIVFGTTDDMQDLGMRNGTFAMDDACGTSWVAPRSMVEARENLLRWARRTNGGNHPVEVQIQLQPGKPR